RARELIRPLASHLDLLHGNEGTTVGPGGERALAGLLNRLGQPDKPLLPPGPAPEDQRGARFETGERQKQQVEQLVEHTQRLVRRSERARDETFWKPIKASSGDDWSGAAKVRQSNLWD